MPIFKYNNKNILFIHIPKCAGSSVQSYLFGLTGGKKWLSTGDAAQYFSVETMVCSPQHIHGELIRQLFKLDRFHLIFTVVRCPLSRMLSEYRMRYREGHPIHGHDFGSWYNIVRRHYASNNFYLDNHLRPATEFIVDQCRIFKLEDGLENAMASILGDLGVEDRFKGIGKNPARNQKVPLPPESKLSITDETRRLVQEDYLCDYHYFDYNLTS